MRILVTGAGGHLGRATTARLAGLVSPAELVLVTRHPPALSPPAGVTVREGDFDAPETLTDAFAGCDRMLLISTGDLGRRAVQHRAALEAAVRAGVRHVVYTSMIRPEPDHPAGTWAQEHLRTEEALRGCGTGWTVLRNGYYADSLLPVAAQAVEQGQLVTNSGQGRIAYVSRDDCAAVAAAVLTGDGHQGRTYDVTGGEALDAEEVCARLSTIGGRLVSPVLLDDDAFTARLVSAGLPEAAARLVAGFGTAARNGYYQQVSPAVQTLTGSPPRTLGDVLARLAHPEAARS